MSDWFKTSSSSSSSTSDSSLVSTGVQNGEKRGVGSGDSLKTFRLQQEIRTLKVCVCILRSDIHALFFPQDKNSALEKENQVLRKELSKHSGVTIRPGGQVLLSNVGISGVY